MHTDIIMIGHISQDILIDHLQNRQEILGGAVVYSSFAASAGGGDGEGHHQARRSGQADLG